MATLRKLESLLQELESSIPYLAYHNNKISKKSADWHIDHSLKVLIQVMHALKTSDPETYKQGMNLQGHLVCLLGKIPRGVGKAPKTVVHLQDKSIVRTELEEQLNQARRLIKDFISLDERAYFVHPLFGQMKKKPALRLMEIHTRHHLQIIQEIIAQGL